MSCEALEMLTVGKENIDLIAKRCNIYQAQYLASRLGIPWYKKFPKVVFLFDEHR
jgi:hypothetical protein